MRRVCRSEREQGEADDQKDGAADQLAAVDHAEKGLYAHPTGVNEAGPGGEGYDAAALLRTTDGKQTTDAQGDIKADHHGQRSLGADEADHRNGEEQKECAYDPQHSFERSISSQRAPLRGL